MKHIKFNKKMNNENININISSRPFSVHTYHQRKDISFKSPLNKKINYSFYNKYIYTNNYHDTTKLNLKTNQKLLEYKPIQIINEQEEINEKQKFDNLNVKIFNLYNIKDKNEPFAIKINNNSPKYYINNCVNQLLIKKLSPKNKIKNVENSQNNKSKNNINLNIKDNNFQNNRYILSLISPKTRNYKKKIDISKNNASNNIINIQKSINAKTIKKNSKDITNIRMINHKGQNRIINLSNYSNYSYSYINKESPKNIYKNNDSIPEEKMNIINNSNKVNFNKCSNNEGIKTHKNIEIKGIMNKNKTNFYNKVLDSNLTLEIPERMSFNKKCFPKKDNINNNQNNSYLNSNNNKIIQNNYLFSDNKQEKAKIKKKNRVVNSIFDLKNFKFESKTLNEIIQEFNENEEIDSEKSDIVNTDKMKSKIPHQKIKHKQIIKNNKIIKVPKNSKKEQKNNFDIYLQYNQKNDVEKIFLNDKKGKITHFIPMKKYNDKFNTIDETKNKNIYNILDI